MTAPDLFAVLFSSMRASLGDQLTQYGINLPRCVIEEIASTAAKTAVKHPLIHDHLNTPDPREELLTELLRERYATGSRLS